MTSTPTFKRRSILIGLAGAAGLAGCATAGTAADEALADAAALEYKLGPGDQLRIIVFNEPDLSSQYLVSAQGLIAYPLVGTVEAAGLTLSEFTTRLQTALQQYIRQPNVSVEVANYRPFFILGEVTRPGTYPYSANLTVQNAVATAGGFTYRANRGRVYIKHASEQAERAYRLTNSTPVLPGDTIRIGERLF
jgi:polysaccharide biosynthesis/export protein